MAPLREGVRRGVLSAAALLRDAGGGVLDAARELASPRTHQQSQLHDELELARMHGRWLSEEEREHLQVAALRRAQRRRVLLVLLALSVLIPPLWLLMPIWIGLLAWPQTTRRLLFGLLAAGILLVVPLVVLLLWLLLR